MAINIKKYQRSFAAFTLIELLVVVAIVSVLAGLLVPVIGSMREQGRRVQCLNNLRQHGMAWHMYLSDHDDKFPPFQMNPVIGSPQQGYIDYYTFGGKEGSSYKAWYPSGTCSAQYRALNRYLDITNDTSPSTKLFQCPNDTKPSIIFVGTSKTAFDFYGNSYWCNGVGLDNGGASPLSLSSIVRSKSKFFLETCYPSNLPGHSLKGNLFGQTPLMVLFVDGHVFGPVLQEDIEEGWTGIRDDTKKVYTYPDY